MDPATISLEDAAALIAARAERMGMKKAKTPAKKKAKKPAKKSKKKAANKNEEQPEPEPVS
jgi:topoisomerase IA-like protein